jgi:ATP-dependent DNA helicase RecG
VVTFDIEKREDGVVTPIVTSIVTPIVTPIISSGEQNLLDIIENNNRITREKLAAELNVSVNTVKTVIFRLKKKGILNREGNNKTGYWKIIR